MFFCRPTYPSPNPTSAESMNIDSAGENDAKIFTEEARAH